MHLTMVCEVITLAITHTQQYMHNLPKNVRDNLQKFLKAGVFFQHGTDVIQTIFSNVTA